MIVHQYFKDPQIKEELEFRMDLLRDYEAEQGLEPASDHAVLYTVASDLETFLETAPSGWKAAWLTALRRYFIAIGRDVEITDEEMKRTTVFGRGHFYRLDGKRYGFDNHPERGLLKP